LNDPRPKVTVVLPVYDGEAYLPEALDSLASQTFPDFEVIAVDDGSRDRSWEVLQAYAERDPRFRPIRHERNLGHHEACNRGIASARGELLAKFDQDDVNLPERLERQVSFMTRHPEVGLLGASYYRWPGGETRWLRTPPTTHTGLRWKLLFGNVICHSAVMLRAALASTGELYYAALPGPQDYDLWVRLLRHTRGASVPEPLVLYRVYSSDGRAGAMSELFKDRQPAAVADISVRQLTELMPDARPDEIVELRRVAFGAIGRGELPLVGRVLDLYERFARLPDVDSSDLDVYKRRFLWHCWSSLRKAGGSRRERIDLLRLMFGRAPSSAARFLALELPGLLVRRYRPDASDLAEVA
jgi:hypothetical protein